MKALRIILAFISGVFLCWFLFPVSARIICFGNVAGIIFCTFVIIRCIFNNQFKKLRSKFFSGGAGKVVWHICQFCIVAFVVYGVVISSFMVYFANKTPQEGSTVITLGAMVRPSGVPSSSLRERINACYNYLAENPDAKTVLSGGKGENEPMSEAECMYRELTAMGISKDRLFIEDKSKNTDENIKNSLDIIKKNNLSQNIAIATDSYHQMRGKIIMDRQEGDYNVGAVNSKSPKSVFPTYWVREWFAIPVELLKSL